MMRDCLFQHLTDEKLQKSTFSGAAVDKGSAHAHSQDAFRQQPREPEKAAIRWIADQFRQ
eukprot:2888401-Rhodomonas_salina.3